MKLKNKFIATFALAALVALFAVGAFGQTETPQTGVALYGIQSLVYGQSLRVAVQNPRFSDAEIVPCIRVRSVFDVYENNLASTERLRPVRRVTREASLCAGEAALFDLPAAREGSLIGTSVFTSCENLAACDGSVRVAATLSLREAGRTILNLPAVEKGFDPQPDPPEVKQPLGGSYR